MNLNDLYALDAILHASSLTLAGRMISLSQPAMSMALRKLRGHFDDELVIYSAGQVQLTALAQELRQRSRRLLHAADDMFHLTLDFDPATTTRTIVVSAPETIEIMFLSHVVSALLHEAPGIAIELIPFEYDAPERMFDRGADIALIPEALASDGLVSRPLFDQGLVGMVWARSRFAGERALSREDFLRARHAALTEQIERHEFGAAFDDPIFASRKVVVRTGRHSALPRLVIGTDLIVTTTNWLAQYHAAMLPLTLIDLPVGSRPSTVVAQWQAHRDREPLIRWLIDRMTDVLIEQGPADNRWHQRG